MKLKSAICSSTFADVLCWCCTLQEKKEKESKIKRLTLTTAGFFYYTRSAHYAFDACHFTRKNYNFLFQFKKLEYFVKSFISIF